MTELEKQGSLAKSASRILMTASSTIKDQALMAIADMLENESDLILDSNAQDIAVAKDSGMRESLIDRLMLTKDQIKGIANGVREVAALPDPIGAVEDTVVRPNGLIIGKKTVPLGVIAIIYEARPNVTADAAALCLKSGNAAILRGGKEAFRSNASIMNIMRRAVASAGLPEDCVSLVKDTTRESARELMQLDEYIDVLIPRGGAGLIRSVVENAKVPVIQTGVGNCHVYIDETADIDMGARIIFNAKCQRPSVCNAAETMLVHRSIAQRFLPAAKELLDTKNTEIRGCPETAEILGESVVPATESDWHTEYGDYILAVKVVSGIDEAIEHINRYNTGHSEAIVTNDYSNAQRFLNEVDAAAVYVNASTRFTDGGEFGLGAEIGISTQKLHARGPMGLKQLTSSKYIIYGNGQIR